MSSRTALPNEELLELFFSQSQDGFFFMMLDEPVEWGEHVDKDEVLDFVFTHQRVTKVNPAFVAQFKATSAGELLGMTPAQFFAHDLVGAKVRWREFFDQGTYHSETDERRLDGTPMRVEGDYTVIRDDRGRIAGHFGIQRDVTVGYEATQRVRASRQELRALAARLQRAREEERTAISREIHDELGQALTGIKLDISWMQRRLPRDNDLLAQCRSMVDRIDGTLDTVRRIATELRPSVLDQLGLEAALEWQAQEFSVRTGILVDLDIAVGGATIPEHMASTSFRILQESLTNVARHARASRVAIRLAVVEGELSLEITDDGVGIAPQLLNGGTASLGLVGMRERALAAGGELCIIGRPTLGTTVLLKVPLHPSTA
jgi:signal transduction histidine kinase